MPVTFQIPGPVRPFTGGRGQVTIDQSPATLREAFEALWVLYPGARDRIMTEQGQVREHIAVFVGNQDVRYTGDLATSLPPIAEVTIVPAVSGGWRT